jgi:hypothetical protein
MSHSHFSFSPRALLAALLIGGALTASSFSAAQAASADVIPPNANLFTENIPPIPKSLADAVARYSDFRGHGFVAWHPKKLEMIVTHREAGASTAQLYWVKSPMGKEVPITKHPEPVGSATIEPTEGKYILFESSKGGSEQDQLFRLDRDGEQALQLTDSKMRHDFGAWRRVNGKPTGEILVSSVALDRFMSEEEKKKPTTTLRLMDPLSPDKAKTVATLDGTGWFSSTFSYDGQKILLTKYLSANESEAWVMNIADGKLQKLLPLDNAAQRRAFRGPHDSRWQGALFRK